jgi:GNAT superfamily N-acetyltransferase
MGHPPSTILVKNVYALVMDDATCPVEITIRPAVSRDADGIARTFCESAEYHAGLDPERYAVPAIEAISARYREGRQHPPHAAARAITLVAEVSGEIVGFVDARLEQSPDPMHREMTYCHIVEIAVTYRRRNQGIGGRLLRAAEDWGRGQGAEFASLEYLAANVRAGSFYQQRMGYRLASMIAIKRLS